MRDVGVFHGVRGPPVKDFTPRSVPMYPSRLLALHFSPLVLAVVLLDGYSIAQKSAEPQSSQQAAPPLSQRSDVTKPLEDKSVQGAPQQQDRKSTRLNSSHPSISYAVFCLKKK